MPITGADAWRPRPARRGGVHRLTLRRLRTRLSPSTVQHNIYNQAVRALNTLAFVAEERRHGDVLPEVRELRRVIEQLHEQFAAPVAAILDAMRHDREG